MISLSERQCFSLIDFVKITFKYLNLDWKKYVVEDKGIITKKNYCRIGNSKKLMRKTGWKSSVDFKEMIRLILAADGAFLETV